MPRTKCFVHHLVSIAVWLGAPAIAAAPSIGCGGTVTPALGSLDGGAPSLEGTADSAGMGSIDALFQLPAGESVSPIFKRCFPVFGRSPPSLPRRPPEFV